MEMNVVKIEHKDGNIVVHVDTKDGLINGWPLHIPVAALDTRKAIYNLDTDEAALEALIREQAIHINSFVHELDIRPELDPSCEYLDWKKEHPVPEHLEPEGDLKLHEFGGTHSGVDVKYHGDTSKHRNKILKSVSSRPELPDTRKEELRAKALAPVS